MYTHRRSKFGTGVSAKGRQQFPIWRSKRVWGMLGEDVGSRGRFLLLQNLHSRHPWRSSCRQAPMDGFTA